MSYFKSDEDEKPKPKYIKQSQRSIVPTDSLNFNFRSKSIAVGQKGNRYAENQSSIVIHDKPDLHLPNLEEKYLQKPSEIA